MAPQGTYIKCLIHGTPAILSTSMHQPIRDLHPITNHVARRPRRSCLLKESLHFPQAWNPLASSDFSAL
jgi:hypothetical protein